MKRLAKIKILGISLSSIVKGMSAPAQVYTVNTYRYPHKSERDALRSDWERVGGDFLTVIKREHGKVAS